jgi:hypothetical protein
MLADPHPRSVSGGGVLLAEGYLFLGLIPRQAGSLMCCML